MGEIMSEIKYYLADVWIAHGDFEHMHAICFETSGDPKDYHEQIVRNWFADGDAEKDVNGWYWNDYLVYKAGSLNQIEEYAYQEVKCHICPISLEVED